MLRFGHQKRECARFAFKYWNCDGFLKEKNGNPLAAYL